MIQDFFKRKKKKKDVSVQVKVLDAKRVARLDRLKEMKDATLTISVNIHKLKGSHAA